MDRETKKEKTELKKDLHFYLDYYHKVPERMREVFDAEIERIIERLKEIGK